MGLEKLCAYLEVPVSPSLPRQEVAAAGWALGEAASAA